MREDKRIKELQRLALNTKRILRETNFLWFKLFIECTRYCLIAHFCISFIHIFLLANNIIIKGKCASVFPMKQGFVYKLLLRGMIETWHRRSFPWIWPAELVGWPRFQLFTLFSSHPRFNTSNFYASHLRFKMSNFFIIPPNLKNRETRAGVFETKIKCNSNISFPGYHGP